MAECSNAGVCDPLTGFCVCRAGYTGDACQRLTCPPYIEEGEENVDNICNGHGTCESMERAAANYGMDTSDGSIGDGRGPGYTNWDKTIVRGCVCSWGYTGEDCTLKLCPKNDDPLTTGQSDLVFTIVTDAASGALAGKWKFSFYGHSTSFSAVGDTITDTECQNAMMALPNVETATCAVSSSTSQKGATHTITLTKYAPIPVENNVYYHMGSPELSHFGCTPELLSGGTTPSCQITITTASTKEYIACSNRGICNSVLGECVCFTNFYGPDCHSRGVTSETVDNAAGMTISSTGDSYTGNVLELASVRGSSSAFNFLKATASGIPVFTVRGDGQVIAANGVHVTKGGATIAAGGLTLDEGEISIYDDGSNPVLTAGAMGSGFTSDILRLDAKQAASTNFNFFHLRSDFDSGGVTRFKIDGSGQVFITATTASTSTTTGSLTTTGGVGIAKALYVGEKVVVMDTTVATSSTTGSVTIAGGLGIAGNIYSGGGFVVEDGGAFFANSATGDVDVVTLTQSDTSGFTGSLLRLEATQAAATSWNLIEAQSSVGGTPVDLFSVRGDGLVSTAGRVSITTGGLEITAGGLTAGGGITCAAGGFALSSTSSQAITHTGASNSHLTVSSTNGYTYVEGVKFDGTSITGMYHTVTTINSDTTLTTASSSQHIFLNNAAGLTVTLPSCDASAVGAFFEFYVLTDTVDTVSDQSGYKINRAGSDTITGSVQVISSSGSYHAPAASSAQQLRLDGFGKCAFRYAIKTCTSQDAATYGNATTCTSDPCASVTDCPNPTKVFFETYADACNNTAQTFCVTLDTKATCITTGGTDRDTAQDWVNGPGGDIGSKIRLECIAETLWHVSGVVVTDEATSGTEALALTGNV